LTGDRRALASVGGQFFINGAVVASFVPRLPEIRDRLDLTVDEIGLILAAAGAFGVVGSAVVSPLIERFGSRRVVIGGGFGLIAGLVLIALADRVPMLLVGLAAISAFDLIADSGMNLQASWISARRSTPVMNRLHGLWSLGTVIGGTASAWVAAGGVSIQTHLLASAALLSVALVVVATGLLRTDEATTPAEGSLVAPGARAASLGVFALLGAGAFAVEITSSDWAAFRLTDDLASSAGVAGLGFVAFTVGMTTGRFAGDWLQARLGADRLLNAALVVAAIGITGASLVGSETVALLLFVVAGIGIAPLFPRLYDEAAQRPGRKGAGLGALTAGSRAASLITPAVVGGLAATRLSVGAAVIVVVLPLLAGIGWLRHQRTIVRSGA
jgi:fucose permease